MRPDLTDLTQATPPFTSVALDVTHTDPANTDDVRRRWRRLAQDLLEQGAPEDVVDVLAEVVTEPTGAGGERTRVVVATDTVVLDQLLPGRPPTDEATHGPVPLVLPLLRTWSRFFPYAVVRLDRAGADIDVVTAPDRPVDHVQAEGGHDVLHKVPGGGFAHRRFQARVEDSWLHNASAVGDELARLQRRHGLELVLVAGDDKAWAHLRDQAAEHVATRLVRLPTGGRADGVSQDAEDQAVTEALDEWRARRREEVLDTYRAERGKQRRVAEGLGPVVAALRRGQVDTVLLRDDPTSTARLWLGGEPVTLGERAEDVRAEAGDGGGPVAEPVELRADLALAWAVVGTGADLLLLDEAALDLADGIGAVLRWNDDDTPHQPEGEPATT